MPRGNPDKIKPHQVKSGQEARERGSKGGIRSGQVRREKSAASDVARMILSGHIPVESAKTLVRKMGLPETELNVQAAIIAGQAIAAMKGNHKAAEFVLGLVGETPSDQVNISAEQSRGDLKKMFTEVDHAAKSDPSKIFNEQAPPDDDR